VSSYISSFKALLAALVIVAVIEVSYSAADTSSPVERSGYLNWNFNSAELFHKVMIYEKLRHAVQNAPDVIQIGDSSGFHAVVPRIVDHYLGGLKYDNLSCCANTTFDGYYTIAEFMLRNVPTIKAVVLYISLNQTTVDPILKQTDIVGGDDRLRSAFGWFAPFTSPATLSARAGVLRSVYTLGHTLDQPGLQPFDINPAFDDLTRSIRASDGWWAEHDAHPTTDKQLEMWATICGRSSARPWPDLNHYYTRDIFGRQQLHMQIELRRLARLTARHNAKLIVIFQPHPCQAAVGDFIAVRQADIAAVLAEHPNVVVPIPALFEPWPRQWFTSADHLRTGHEDAASRRVGRAVAESLGLPAVDPPEPPPPAATIRIWSSTDFAAPPWQPEHLVLGPQMDGGGGVVTETADRDWHRLHAALPDLQAKTYVLSLTFLTDGARQIRLEMRDLQWPGAYGVVRCNVSDGESWRGGAMLDSGLEELPDHAFRCWGKLKLTKPGAEIAIGLSPSSDQSGPYQGDGRASVVLQKVDISAIVSAEE
jgi:hypothetical protein